MASSSSTDIQLAWLDSNMYSDDNRALLEKIRALKILCNEFVEESPFIAFLGRGHNDPRRFNVIISGALGEKLVPEIHNRENIFSIYIYCTYREKHEKWSKHYHKAKVVTSHEELLSKLKLELDRYGHH